jgi:hypothetical protein
MKGFKPYTPQDAERVLVSLGIVAKTKKGADNMQPAPRRDKDKPGNKRGEKGKGGRGNFRRGEPPRGGPRRSPPGGRRHKSVLCFFFIIFRLGLTFSLSVEQDNC